VPPLWVFDSPAYFGVFSETNGLGDNFRPHPSRGIRIIAGNGRFNAVQSGFRAPGK